MDRKQPFKRTRSSGALDTQMGEADESAQRFGDTPDNTESDDSFDIHAEFASIANSFLQSNALSAIQAEANSFIALYAPQLIKQATIQFLKQQAKEQAKEESKKKAA